MTGTKIGILGSGDVGRSLGGGLVAHGYDVMIGSRNPDSDVLTAWKASTGGTTGSSMQAAEHGEIVIVATQFEGTPVALQSAGLTSFTGKVVIDVTNPLDFSQGGPPHLAVDRGTSAGEKIQDLLPDAYVVKAFNIVNARFMIDPDFADGPPTMCIAGNDGAAKKTVTTLLEEVGWDVADLGPITASRYIEGMAMCWIWYGFATDTWDHAFRLLRK